MADESPQPNVLGSGSLRALSLRFWLLLIATGALAGVAGGGLMLLLRAVQHLCWPYAAADNFLSAVKNATPLRILVVVSGAGLLAGLVRFVLRQETSGGHAGDLAETIWFAAGRLEPLRTLVRAVLSIVIVGMGASLGREAAPKQAGALIASILAQWTNLPPSQRRLLAACGAGAGIAAVYNVPFGGAMFALEVLLGTISLPLVPAALTATFLGTAFSWLLLPNVPTYHVPFYPVTASQIVWAVIAGPAAGLVSVAYVRLISRSDALLPRGIFAVIVPVVIFAGLAVAALRFPELLGNGKDVVQETFVGQPGFGLLLALVVLKPIVTAACLGSGAPGGLFTPTLTLGALLGGLLGQLWLSVWPGTPLGAFAMVGACAVLAASTQGPISAIVLTLELTRRLDTLIVPILIATAGAVLVARLIEHRSIYSGRIHLGRSAAGGAIGEKDASGFVALSSSARFVELLQGVLRAGNREPVYVVDEAGRLIGQVEPSDVRSLRPKFLPLETASAVDFARPVPSILSSDCVSSIADKLERAGLNSLPVVDATSQKLIGVHHRAD